MRRGEHNIEHLPGYDFSISLHCRVVYHYYRGRGSGLPAQPSEALPQFAPCPRRVIHCFAERKRQVVPIDNPTSRVAVCQEPHNGRRVVGSDPGWQRKRWIAIRLIGRARNRAPRIVIADAHRNEGVELACKEHRVRAITFDAPTAKDTAHIGQRGSQLSSLRTRLVTLTTQCLCRGQGNLPCTGCLSASGVADSEAPLEVVASMLEGFDLFVRAMGRCGYFEIGPETGNTPFRFGKLALHRNKFGT